MAYDRELDERLSDLLSGLGTERKTMFGGTGHLLNGNMLAGVHGDDLVVRVGPAAGAEALKDPSARPFDITGHPMDGWLMVEPAGVEGELLAHWVDMAKTYVETLPPKVK
jgi:hypothetical protein